MKNLYKIVSICALLAFSSQAIAVKLNGQELSFKDGSSITYTPDSPGAIGIKISDDAIQVGTTEVTFNKDAVDNVVPQIVADTMMDVGTLDVETISVHNTGVRFKASELIDIKASDQIYKEVVILEGKSKVKLTANKIIFKTCFVKTDGRLHLIANKKSRKWLGEIEIELARGESEFYDSIVNGEIELNNPKTRMLVFTNAKSLTLHFLNPDDREDDTENLTAAVAALGLDSDDEDEKDEDAAVPAAPPAPAAPAAAVSVNDVKEYHRLLEKRVGTASVSRDANAAEGTQSSSE